MVGTLPSTPESKTRVMTCPDTEPRHSYTSRDPYLSGDLTLGRQAVLDDLKRYLQVPFKQLVSAVWNTLPDDSEIAEIRNKMKLDGLITSVDERWIAFANKPSASTSSEHSIFLQLTPIISYIFGQVSGCLFQFNMAPNRTPHSTRNNTSRPDAYIRLEASPTAKDMVHWFDIAIPFGFKKSNDDKLGNEGKIIWSLHNIMREDPLRRFTLGITIEDTNLRIWHHSRSLLSVSASIDFTEEIDSVISLFYVIARQTKEDVGWDPTVERVSDKQYVFKVCGNKYTTTKELATYRADAMIGSATRVYEAKDQRGRKVAIKDSWRDVDRQSEGEIMEQILDDIREKLGEEQLMEAKKYIVGVREHEDVKISGECDRTLDPARLEGGEWIKINGDPELSETLHLLHSDYLPPLQRIGNETKRLPHKIHARIVFDDVGIPLTQISVLGDNASCLRDALQGLRYVHLAGWMHRDVSVTNVLWVKDDEGKGDSTGKLTDFEYAKSIESNVSHEVRTGTMHFMAIEVDHQGYLFLPGSTDFLLREPPFRMNALHDLESAWWIVVWTLLYHTDKAKPATDLTKQLGFFNMAFPGTIQHASRHHFFTNPRKFSAACSALSETYRNCKRIWALGVHLQNSYKDAEKEEALLPKICSDQLEEIHLKAKEALDELAQLDIQLQPISAKRHADVESAQPRKKAKRSASLS